MIYFFVVGYMGLKIFPGVGSLLLYCVFIVMQPQGGALAHICHADVWTMMEDYKTETSGAPSLHRSYK